MADVSALAPLQLTQFSHEELQTPEGVNNLNQFLSILTQRVNAVGPSTGSSAEFPNGIDLSGAHARNVGGMGPEHTAISFARAQELYSAKAIAPQLEAGQPNSLRSVRRINDNAQRENFSQFMEGTLNTAPTTNTSNISGSGMTVHVTSGFHLLVSGNVQPYAARTDTLPASSSVTIVSISRTASVVTAITTTPSGFTVGSSVLVSAVSDATFDGAFVLTSAVGTTLKWTQVAINASSTGGSVGQGNCWLYRLPVNSKTLALYGPYAADSQENRHQANLDGGVLIAVAVFNGGGFDVTNSAAGATPPSVTGNVHILTRL